MTITSAFWPFDMAAVAEHGYERSVGCSKKALNDLARRDIRVVT